jgi:hypothetical protein
MTIQMPWQPIRVAQRLGDAMVAVKRSDDAEARCLNMFKEVDACRATPIKAAA